MRMCVQGCHILRFLKKNTPRHVGDQYVVRMQKGIKIGPVVWPLTRSASQQPSNPATDTLV